MLFFLSSNVSPLSLSHSLLPNDNNRGWFFALIFMCVFGFGIIIILHFNAFFILFYFAAQLDECERKFRWKVPMLLLLLLLVFFFKKNSFALENNNSSNKIRTTVATTKTNYITYNLHYLTMLKAFISP